MELPAKTASTIYIREDLAGDKSGNHSPGGAVVPSVLTCLLSIRAKPVLPRAAPGMDCTLGLLWDREALAKQRGIGKLRCA